MNHENTLMALSLTNMLSLAGQGLEQVKDSDIDADKKREGYKGSIEAILDAVFNAEKQVEAGHNYIIYPVFHNAGYYQVIGPNISIDSLCHVHSYEMAKNVQSWLESAYEAGKET